MSAKKTFPFYLSKNCENQPILIIFGKRYPESTRHRQNTYVPISLTNCGSVAECAGRTINRSRVRIPAGALSSATLDKLFTHVFVSLQLGSGARWKGNKRRSGVALVMHYCGISTCVRTVLEREIEHPACAPLECDTIHHTIWSMA